MKTMMMTIVGLALILGQVSAQYNQRATLFSGSNSQGSSINIIETYASDLTASGFNNRAYSACVTGAWLFYDATNFNPSNALMEYMFGPNNYCANFQGVAGIVSSARFAGDPKDYTKDTITLYTGNYFQGTEEYAVNDLATLNLDLQASSLIVTGKTAWTLYDQPKFSGNKVCVQPASSTNYAPAFIYDTVNISVPNKTIRSIRKGCFTRRIVVADSVTRGSPKSVQEAPENVNVAVSAKGGKIASTNKF